MVAKSAESKAGSQINAAKSMGCGRQKFVSLSIGAYCLCTPE
jgi:hypothetical protein